MASDSIAPNPSFRSPIEHQSHDSANFLPEQVSVVWTKRYGWGLPKRWDWDGRREPYFTLGVMRMTKRHLSIIGSHIAAALVGAAIASATFSYYWKDSLRGFMAMSDLLVAGY
jgi:hypothetical protein